MIFALVALVFMLVYGTAIIGSSDPKSSQGSINRFFRNIRLFIDSLHLSPPLTAGGITVTGNDQKNLEDGRKSLLTRAQLEEKYEVGSWQRDTFEDFKSILLAQERDLKTYPCIFATKGFRANDHRYVFLDSDDPSEPRNVRYLGPAMQVYLEEAHHLGPNTSLVIICGPSETIGTVDDYNSRFWSFLRGLRIFDREAWPEDVPGKTKDEHWTFCFNGEPLFPIALTPAHEKRKSRYASNPIIAMQPKWVIDNLMSTPEKRKSATSTVRKLLQKYDDVEISPDLKDYGLPGTRESLQLTLRDENTTAECPYEDLDV